MSTEPSDATTTPPVPPPPEDPAVLYARVLEALTPKVWLVSGVIALNVLVFVGMIGSGVSPMEPTVEGLIRWGANFGPLTTGGQWWRLLTSTFVHIGFFHIAMNMWVLWDIGRFMERLLGPGGFLVMYLFAGLTGASRAWPGIRFSSAPERRAPSSGSMAGCSPTWLASAGTSPRNRSPGSRREPSRSSATTFSLDSSARGSTSRPDIGGLAGGFAIGLLLCHAPTPQAAGRRAALALRGAILGCATVVAVSVALPTTPDIEAEAKRFDAVSSQVVDATNAAMAAWRAGTLDDIGFADRLEQDVLPPWRAARESLAGLHGLPKSKRDFVTGVVRYADQRTAAWELLATGARTNDSKKAWNRPGPSSPRLLLMRPAQACCSDSRPGCTGIRVSRC